MTRPLDDGRTTNDLQRAQPEARSTLASGVGFGVRGSGFGVLGSRFSVLGSWFSVLAALIALVLLGLGGARAWPLSLDVGGRDERFVSGFLETEHFGSMDVRWSTGDSQLALPRPPADGPSVLTLRLLNSRPADQPDPQITLSADGRVLGQFSAIRRLDAARHYRVLVPAGAGLGWATTFRLQMEPFTLANDPRPLGVVLDRAVFEPLGSSALPSLWLALSALALGLAAYGLPRMLGARPAAALGVSVGLAALLAAGVAARPLEVLPFLQRIPALLGLGCLGLALARALTRTLAPACPDPARPIGLEALVVYLALAWWLGPLFQLVMIWDGAVNVWPAIPTMWIGAGLALGLLLTQLPALRSRLAGSEARLASLDSWFPAVLGLFAVAALLHLAYMIYFAFTRSGPDFWILFKGAREWARGGSLYDLNAIQTDHFGHVFKVPPFYGMLFVPFVFQDGLEILFWHRVLNTILLGLTGLVWLRMWGLRLVSAAGAGLLVLLNCRPFADTIAFGQIDLLLLLLLSLALWALRDERDLLAGALIALGTLFKIYPVLLLAFLVAKRQWRALAGFGLGMLLYNGWAVAVMGWEMHRVYLFEVLPKIGGTTSWVENQTVSGFLARLVSPPTVAEIFANRSLALLGTAISGGLGLLGCALALPEAPRRSTGYALQYGAFLLLMVLVVPAAWMHYETLLLVPFAVLLLRAREQPMPLARAAALALGFALVAYGNQWSYYDGTVMGLLTVAGVSYKFYGMLLLGAVLVTMLLESAPLSLPRLARLALRPSQR